MTIYTLKSILQAHTPIDAHEQQEIDRLLVDLEHIVKHSAVNSQEDTEVVPVTLHYLMDVFNEQTYDDYGLARVAKGGELTEEDYMSIISNKDLLHNVGRSAIDCSLDLIVDLWQENEEADANNLDGTFDKDAKL